MQWGDLGRGNRGGWGGNPPIGGESKSEKKWERTLGHGGGKVRNAEKLSTPQKKKRRGKNMGVEKKRKIVRER